MASGEFSGNRLKDQGQISDRNLLLEQQSKNGMQQIHADFVRDKLIQNAPIRFSAGGL